MCKCLYRESKKKELYTGIPNVAVWQVLRKFLHLKIYELFIVQGVEHLERCIACTLLSTSFAFAAL
jgi:hypothetical protein